MSKIARILLFTLPAAGLVSACTMFEPAPPPPVAAAPPTPVIAGAMIAPAPAATPAYSGSSTPPVVAPGSAIRLSSNDASALLSNNTAIGLTNTGVPYAVYFAGDGAAHFREATIADTGTWRILPDGEVCSHLPAISPQDTCYILSRYGDVILYQSPDGLALGSVRIVSGNPQAL